KVLARAAWLAAEPAGVKNRRAGCAVLAGRPGSSFTLATGLTTLGAARGRSIQFERTRLCSRNIRLKNDARPTPAGGHLVPPQGDDRPPHGTVPSPPQRPALRAHPGRDAVGRPPEDMLQVREPERLVGRASPPPGSGGEEPRERGGEEGGRREEGEQRRAQGVEGLPGQGRDEGAQREPAEPRWLGVPRAREHARHHGGDRLRRPRAGPAAADGPVPTPAPAARQRSSSSFHGRALEFTSRAMAEAPAPSQAVVVHSAPTAEPAVFESEEREEFDESDPVIIVPASVGGSDAMPPRRHGAPRSWRGTGRGSN
ncbi:hypothetical protein THAOC_18636, partial [Thalassiosira oceanica]